MCDVSLKPAIAVKQEVSIADFIANYNALKEVARPEDLNPAAHVLINKCFVLIVGYVRKVAVVKRNMNNQLNFRI